MKFLDTEGVRQLKELNDAAYVGKEEYNDDTMVISAALNDLNSRLEDKQDALTFDSTPTSGSTNPVTSGGVYTALSTAGDSNVIETVKVNGTALTVTDKAVDVTVPTTLASLTDDSTHRLVTDTEKTTWNSKIDSANAQHYYTVSTSEITSPKEGDITSTSEQMIAIFNSSNDSTWINYGSAEKLDVHVEPTAIADLTSIKVYYWTGWSNKPDPPTEDVLLYTLYKTYAEDTAGNKYIYTVDSNFNWWNGVKLDLPMGISGPMYNYLYIKEVSNGSADSFYSCGSIRAIIPEKVQEYYNGSWVLRESTPFTSSERTKLQGIAAGAEVNVQSDWSVTDSTSDAYIANKPTIPTKVSDLTNDSGYITGYTETDPVFTASAAHGITSSDISNWNGKQDTLVSGENIKTVNNQSLLGGGDLTITGRPGSDGVGISSIVQTTESTESGGTNVITVTKSDGTSSTFNVRNGDAVGSATIVQTTGDSTTSVMSQDGTTRALQDAMQKVQVGTSMVFAGRTVTKLSAAQVAAINAAEEITIKWVIKSPTQNMAYRYAVVLSMMPYYYINYSFFQSISVKQNISPNANWLGYYVNGDNTTNAKNRMCCNQSVIINRVTGRVRWYENSTLCVDETSNDYKADKFINDDGLIGFESGDTEMRFYALQIYDSDISWFFQFPDNSVPMSQVWREGEGKDVTSYVKGNLRNYGYQFMSSGHRKQFYGGQGHTTGGTDSATTPYYVSFVDGTAVSGTSYIQLGMWNKDGSFLQQYKIVRFPITVSGGVVSIPEIYHYNNNVYASFNPWTKVYDSNGDLVADQTSIGAGDYTVEFLCAYGPGAQMYYISGSPTVTARDNYSYKPICCVVSIDFGLLYDKYLIDSEADTVYPLWRANGINSLAGLQWAETNKYDANYIFSKAPILSVYYSGIEAVDTGSAMPPSMNGDIVIKNGTIYYGDADARTWKRINNA